MQTECILIHAKPPVKLVITYSNDDTHAGVWRCASMCVIARMYKCCCYEETKFDYLAWDLLTAYFCNNFFFKLIIHEIT
jgi:hypothetical protein